MNIILSFPLFSIIISFVGAVICAITNKKVSYIFGLIIPSIVFALSMVTLIYCLRENQSFIYTMGHFKPEGEEQIRLCNEIRFGPLECLLACAFSLVIILSVLGGKKWLFADIKKSKIHFYFTLICLVLVACISLIYTNDIFTGYVFLEISTIASCGILMIKEKGKTTLAAIRYMIFNLVGSGLFLIGITLLYDLTGYLSIENIASEIVKLPMSPALIITFVLITVGLSIKSGLFPFHFWMPDAYGSATPTSSSLLSGVISKGYIILLIKVIFRMFTYEVVEPTGLFTIFFIFGVLGMIVGSFNAIHQTSINHMIAFSSAAQIGYIYMGIGLGSNMALLAAVFHMLTHAVTKPLLFISSAKLSETCNNSQKFRHLRGSARVDKLSGAAFCVGAFSMVGLPLFAGFMSKYLFAEAAINAQRWMLIVTIIALVFSTVLNAIYFVRTVLTIYLPVEKNTEVEVHPVKHNVSYIIGIFGFIAFNIFLGLGSDFVTDILEKGIELFK